MKTFLEMVGENTGKQHFQNVFYPMKDKSNWNSHKVPHTPTQSLVTEQVSFDRKKKIYHVSAQIVGKSLHLKRILTSKIVGI